MAALRFHKRFLTPRNAARGLWFEEALAAEGQRVAAAPLNASVAADVCIVGGGFTGLWAALEIKQRAPSTEVVLIESDVCGGGASGRNGGFVMTWWSKFTTLQKLCGTERALGLARRAERAVSDIGSFCDQRGINADFRSCGWLWTATNTEQVDAWTATVEALEAAGANPFELLSRTEVAQRSGSPVHLAGVFEQGAATLQPALLARGLAQAAMDAGVRVYEHTAMKGLRGGDTTCVTTQCGAVHAPVVILAINAWASRIAEIRRALVVVSSDIVVTEPVLETLDAIGWRDGPAVSDSRRLVNYYRTTPDGRLVFGKGGGSVAFRGSVGPGFHRASPRTAEVAAQFRRTHPMLWRARVESAWRGPIDYSISGLLTSRDCRPSPTSWSPRAFLGMVSVQLRLAGELLAEMAIEGGDAGSARPYPATAWFAPPRAAALRWCPPRALRAGAEGSSRRSRRPSWPRNKVARGP